MCVCVCARARVCVPWFRADVIGVIDRLELQRMAAAVSGGGGPAVPPAAQDIRSATTGPSDAEPEARAYSAQDMALRAALVRMAKAVD